MELRGANIGQPRKQRVPRSENDPNQINVATPTVASTYTESQLNAMTKAELIAIILS